MYVCISACFVCMYTWCSEAYKYHQFLVHTQRIHTHAHIWSPIFEVITYAHMHPPQKEQLYQSISFQRKAHLKHVQPTCTHTIHIYTHIHTFMHTPERMLRDSPRECNADHVPTSARVMHHRSCRDPVPETGKRLRQSDSFSGDQVSIHQFLRINMTFRAN